jgi:hypothetical protein
MPGNAATRPAYQAEATSKRQKACDFCNSGSEIGGDGVHRWYSSS